MVGTNGRLEKSPDGRGTPAVPPVSWAVRAGAEIARSRATGAGAPAAGVAGNGSADTNATAEAWPAQAELVLSALEAGQFNGQAGSQASHAGSNRRALPRRRFRVRAALRLFSDGDQTPPRPLFTRDVHARGLGFITPHRLPLGHGGVVELPADGGQTIAVACTLLRCREAAPGWFEGSLYFNRDQPEFAG